MDKERFRFGAVVMMDALGFKGIWKHHDLGVVTPQVLPLFGPNNPQVVPVSGAA